MKGRILMSNDGRLRLTINFRECDRELYEYLKKKSMIIGYSAYIKTLIAKAKEEEGK